jgi:protein SCO1/2
MFATSKAFRVLGPSRASPFQSSIIFQSPSIFLPKVRYNFTIDPRYRQNPPPPHQQTRNPQQPRTPQPPPSGPKKNVSRVLFMALAAISGFTLSYYQYGRPDEKPVPKENQVQGKIEIAPEQPKIGGPWRLVDLKGELITEKDFQGSYYLLYFGFCLCPDVCPETLSKMNKALDMVKKDPNFTKEKIKTVFVTVDPDRDTPERLDKFLKNFSKDIIGLRGLNNDDPHLKDMLQKFKILVAKIAVDGTHGKEVSANEKSYTMDHTVISYLMDKKNNCISILSPTMSSQDMADNIKKAIEENKK